MEMDIDKVKGDMKKFYSKSIPYMEQLKKHDLSVFGKYLGKIRRYVPKGYKILDVGCGVGQVSNFLQDKGYKMTGVDLSSLLIKEAKKVKKAKFEVMDATELKFEDNSFDAAISAETIEHVPNPRKMIKEMIRVVRPRGYIILRYPNRQNKWKQLGTIITRKVEFELQQPNLGDDVYGNDEDLCHKASTADILIYLKRHGCKIIENKPFFWRAGLVVARKR